MKPTSSQDLPLAFKHSGEINALGIKTITWIEYHVDNTVEIAGMNSLHDEFYNRAKENKDSIEKQLEGFTQLRKRIDRSVRRFPPSSQAIHEQFVRKGELYSISPAVDIYNLVSLATGLSIGAHNLAKIHGNVRLGITQGGELFLPLGSDNERQLPAGEYAYLDDEDRVLCRMEYRQSAHTCLGKTKQDCLFIVQGHEHSSEQQLQQAADEISSLLHHYCHSERGKVWINC